MEFTRTEKKFLELEELKRKYPSSLGEAWSFSGVPENDWMDISDSTASDFIPEYEEQLLQVLERRKEGERRKERGGGEERSNCCVEL